MVNLSSPKSQSNQSADVRSNLEVCCVVMLSPTCRAYQNLGVLSDWPNDFRDSFP